MVEVTVGEQHSHGAKVVLAQHLVQARLDPDPGVDDDALLAGRRRDDPAVRVESGRREPADQHDRPSQREYPDLQPTRPSSDLTGGPPRRTTGIP